MWIKVELDKVRSEENSEEAMTWLWQDNMISREHTFWKGGFASGSDAGVYGENGHEQISQSSSMWLLLSEGVWGKLGWVSRVVLELLVRILCL